MANPYSESLGREWTDAEMMQSKVRLVRLDAEGNPVDSSQVFLVDRVLYQAPDTVDDAFSELVQKAKRVSFAVPLENLSPETVALLTGEDPQG